MQITISKELTDKIPCFFISAYTFELVEKNNQESLSTSITQAFLDITKKYQSLYQLSDVVAIEKIKKTRDGYKKLGKDPSHTRPACEALVRRIIRDGAIYRLGDAIDIGNIISLLTMKSVCMVDAEKLKGNVYIRVGTKEDFYEGIGRGIINVEHLPLYCDELSPFGNPTSDTKRTAISKDTKKILIMLIHFDEDIKEDEQMMLECLNKYLTITNLTLVKVYNEVNKDDE